MCYPTNCTITQYLYVTQNTKYGELPHAKGTHQANSLVPTERAGSIPEVLLLELPVFNGPFDEPRHHDEAEDQDINAREHFVDHG